MSEHVSEPDEPIEPTEPIPTAEEGLPDLGRVATIERELDEVERALARLEDGSYGTCEVCSSPLPDDVLADEPAASRCQEHARPS
jgi:RNA polymerase-binding transcription factor DksA